MVGQDHGLQHVDHLGDVGHPHPVGVGLEDVEIDRRRDGVAQAVLLIEKGAVGARLGVEPNTPFVDGQTDPPSRIIFVHHRAVVADQPVHLQRGFQGGDPLGFSELGRRSLVRPLAGRDGVEMQRDGVDQVAGLGHQGVGPRQVVSVGAAGDLDDRRGAGRPQEGRIASVEIGIGPRAHVPAAAPGLVAHADIVDPPGLVATVGPALAGQARTRVRGQVFEPVARLLRRSATDIGREIGLGPDQFGEVHEFVRAEAVGLLDPAPVRVHADGPAVLGPYAVAPVVGVGKAAAGPADHRDLDRLQRLDDVLAIAMDIGNGRTLAHPDPVIDPVAEMLGELALKLGPHHSAWLVGMDGHLRLNGISRRGRAS